MKALFLVAVGGAVGAVSRYLVHLGLAQRGSAAFPLATFAVNLSGCFLLGGLLAWGEARGTLTPSVRLLLATGFLGAFTTFSTVAVEGDFLFAKGQNWSALLYLTSSVAGGVGAAWAGRALVERLAGNG